MRASSAFLLSLLIAFFTVQSAVAAVDDAGAAILKKQMEETLSPYLAVAKQTGQGITLGGSVAVAPKGTFYEIKLPDLSFVVQEGARLAVGTVIINATPGEKGEYLTTMTIPSSITFYDRINTPAAAFTVGSQRFAGTWWPEKGLYSRYDAEYKNIGMKGLGQEQFSASLSSAKSTLDLKENADGTFSGPNTFDLENLVLEIPSPAKAAMKVDRIVANATYDKLNRKPLLEMRKEMQKLDGGGDAQKAQMAEAIVSRMKGFVDGMTSTMTLTGLTIAGEKPANPADPALGMVPVEIRLDKFVIDYNMQGMLQEKGKASVRIGMGGLKAPALLSPALVAFMPSTANVEIFVDNLPLQKISDTLSSTVKDAIAARETGGAAPDTEAVARSLPQIASDAGMALSIRNTFVDTSDINVTLNGRIQADALALMKTTGNMSLGIRGLDELIVKLQGLSQSDPQAAGYAQALTLFQMMGQAEKTPDGKPAAGKSLRQYNMELTREGKMLLNGSDFSMLTGMMGGGMHGAPQPEAGGTPQGDPLPEEPAENGAAP